MSELLAIGTSYRTAPVEVRERLAITETRAPQFLRELRGETEVHEAVAISTCNRTELYMVVGDPVEAESTVLAMLARQAETRPTELATAIYAHRNCDAARHLYRVVSGLESMILGEAEIQGQVKRAYEAALGLETAGPLTNHLFRAALATGKRVRTETAIGERQLSLPGVAVAMAREQLGPLAGREVVIIGTGETAELTARALADSGTNNVYVANRRRERAMSLARRYGGRTLPLDEVPEVLLTAEIVVAATASPHLLLEVRELADVMQARGGRELLLIDLAVPRDIDAAAAELGGVTLRDIDDLRSVAERNRRVRQGEARNAEGIIEQEIQAFAAWLGSLEVLPTIAALRTHANSIAAQVVGENAGKWEAASERDRARIDAMARAIVNRLLHEPTAAMKEMRDDRVHARMALVRDLFGLSVGDDALAAATPEGELEAARAAAMPDPELEPEQPAAPASAPNVRRLPARGAARRA
ncbi:MAG TPA: glutamyl-tRNA reductase [Solirubrobacteraceae bacterium]|nr:glutamyl-tRNA reductase [Solirubrobacteraceae bacterium]